MLGNEMCDEDGKGKEGRQREWSGMSYFCLHRSQILILAGKGGWDQQKSSGIVISNF